jgi:ubiquinone/menaquinone biosynthesis C-methylase UbiE
MTAQINVGYLMESAAEAARLEGKTDDAISHQQLTLTGLGSGMRALDAGCGTGAVARVMAKIVGPEGSVVAADASAERVEAGRALAAQSQIDNLEFVQADLRAAPVIRESFDYVWSRFLFEYLADPDVVLRQLIEATVVGGKVVVGDLDNNSLIHYPMSESAAAGLARMIDALKGQFDPLAGRKLYHRFQQQGLANIRAHVLPYHVYAGPAPAADMANWTAKFVTLRAVGARAFDSGPAYERWVEEFIDHLRDPAVFTYSTLIIVEGTRVR